MRTTQRQLRDTRVEQMEAIVAEFETPLIRYAARLVNSPTAAQDVVQNVFLKLFKHWRKGTHPGPHVKAWLYRVTHNEAVDLIRRESRLRALHDRQAAESGTACPDGKHCPLSTEEKHATVLRFVRALHPREQQVVLLRLDGGMSYRDIAAVTGRSEGNVGNILHHAVRKLAAKVRKAGLV